MVTPEMISYIKSQQRAAVTEEEIRQKLKQNGGWTDADLDEAFSMIRLEGKAAPVPAPVAPPTSTQPAPASAPVSASAAHAVSPSPSPSIIRPDIAPIGSVSATSAAPRAQAPSAAPAVPVVRKKSRGVMGPLAILILLLAGGASYLYVNDWMLLGTPVMDLLPFGAEDPAPMVMEEETLELPPEMAAEESVPPFLTETKDLVQISKDIANSQIQASESGVPTTE